MLKISGHSEYSELNSVIVGDIKLLSLMAIDISRGNLYCKRFRKTMIFTERVMHIFSLGIFKDWSVMRTFE